MLLREVVVELVVVVDVVSSSPKMPSGLKSTGLSGLNCGGVRLDPGLVLPSSLLLAVVEEDCESVSSNVLAVS